MQKYSQAAFVLLMWNPNIKAMNIIKLVQMIKHFIWILWVHWLSPAWFEIDCSQSMSRFDPYQPQLVWGWPWGIIQWEISSMKLHKPLLICKTSHSTFSLHCTNLFLHFSCVFTFLEIVKPKYWFFLLSLLLQWPYKNSPILSFFFKCMLRWQLSQYSLTKLFQMKLRTTKHC